MDTGPTTIPLPIPWQNAPDRRPSSGLATRARQLMESLVDRPSGQTSVSIYETARLVTLAPWLTGHHQRIRFLLESQHSDGSWGGPEGYGLAPTLSATEALLTALRRRGDREPDHGYLLTAVNRGLRALFHRLRPGRPLALPDMPAIELIVASLVESVNHHLTSLSSAPITGLDAWNHALITPRGIDPDAVAAIRSHLRAGRAVPVKLLHALEIAGGDAEGAAGVRPTAWGTVGASPAATVAWLGARRPPPAHDPSRRHLEEIVSVTGGPVPCGVPITVFERAWVLGGFVRHRIRCEPPIELIASLEAALTDEGAAGGSGLPPDADSTSVTLFTLTRLGRSPDPRCLRHFELATHYCTWPGEQGTSTTVNAHVLEALASTGDTSAVDKVADWLCQQQHADGSWSDRWHASPYYATAACVLALQEVCPHQSDAAIRQAVSWVLDSQRADGSWGRWGGTVEETSYAMQVLLSAATSGGQVPPHQALARGLRYLRAHTDHTELPSLWHDKDLYAPTAIIRADQLAAIHLSTAILAVPHILPPSIVSISRHM